MKEPGERSVNAGGNITGSIIQTGDNNTATLTATALPDAASVDIAAVLTELRAVLASVAGPDAAKIGRALDDADEEAARSEPDKAEIAGTLTRAVALAKKASDFSEHLGKVQELVTKVAGWIGAAGPYLPPLLAVVGLSLP
ncbi:MAG: hypothetical protein V4574_17620 [Pseudomonadota bacterium]